MNKEAVTLINEKISAAQMVLVGIGKELEADDTEKSTNKLQMFYNQVACILEGKNYFVVTTNVDDCIYTSSILNERIVAPCGSIHRFQCSQGCNTLFYNQSEKVCPKCGASLCENTVHAENYIEEGYLTQWNRYMKWLSGTLNKNLCVLEIGVLMDYPGIIRWPFERTAYLNEKAFFIRANERLPQLSAELKDKGVSIKCSPFELLL